jgi:RNase H-fold protein (predicted Holliday junction resolvase)
MAEARRFAARLAEVGVTVRFEPEYYSSVEARRDADGSFVDARAATVILNRYLEKVKLQSGG